MDKGEEGCPGPTRGRNSVIMMMLMMMTHTEAILRALCSMSQSDTWLTVECLLSPFTQLTASSMLSALTDTRSALKSAVSSCVLQCHASAITNTAYQLLLLSTHMDWSMKDERLVKTTMLARNG